MNLQTNIFIDPINEVERELLNLADYLYVHSNIKPYSRVIFILSRLIALNSDLKTINNCQGILDALIKKYPDLLEEQDYNVEFIFELIGGDFSKIKKIVLKILDIAPKGTDTLGLIFNTLLRGKFEAGEGLGTYLTPEEVVKIMVNTSFFYFKKYNINYKKIKFADITGGTGRFIYSFNNICKAFKLNYHALIADQSKFSLDLAKINFILSGDIKKVDIINVNDSIVDSKISKYLHKINIICTNPPFGTNKYLFSQELKNVFLNDELNMLNMICDKSKIDPAIIFFLKNFKLLSQNGVMAIVLPDGVLYSNILYNIIHQIIDDCYFNILAIISLPVATFSLGGTVAKTSFIIIHKSPKKIKSKIYTASVNHIGFLKKGNNKIIDKDGNELEFIEQEILSDKISMGIYYDVEIAFKKNHCDNNSLKNNNTLVREYLKHPIGNKCFHISILDIDETGFINFEKIIKNSPITKPLLCKPYDVIVSCINPKIWRATIVPEINGYIWTCSSEFAVFRCKNIDESINFYFSVMQKNFRKKALSYARGTSSSRQRINKKELLNIRLVLPSKQQLEKIKDLIEIRHTLYLNRLKDLEISVSLWGGSS
jgi:type I restriction-modification system DNA methylase subunit